MSLAWVTVKRKGGDVTIEVEFDENGRLLIGSSDECRVQIPGLLPIHAYLAARSNHVALYIAPGARVTCRGQEIVNDVPDEGGGLERYLWVARDSIGLELAGVSFTVQRCF